MVLSKETLEILKNFAKINGNIFINPGNNIATKSEVGNVIVEAQIDESFEKEFGIYDLNNFLSVYNITDNGDIFINNGYLDITWGNSRIKYMSASPDTLLFPKNKIKFPEHLVEVEIDSSVINTAQTIRSRHLSIVSNGNNVKLKTFDLENSSANTFELDLEVESERKFEAIFSIDLLKILPGKYNVQICQKGITAWRHIERPIVYYIALESASKFE